MSWMGWMATDNRALRSKWTKCINKRFSACDMFWPVRIQKHVGISKGTIPTGPTVHCSITRVRLCLCMQVCPDVWDRQRATGRVSVLLQDQVFQLVCWAEKEGGRLPVSRDELPHRRDLRRAELSRSSTAPTALTVTVGAGGGVWADWLHTQICGTCRKNGKTRVSRQAFTPRRASGKSSSKPVPMLICVSSHHQDLRWFKNNFPLDQQVTKPA